MSNTKNSIITRKKSPLDGIRKTNTKKIVEAELSFNKLSDIDKGYIAGIFDGEGCVSIQKRKSNGKVRVVVSITNTNKEILLWVKNIMNLGHISKDKTKVNLDIYRWITSDRYAKIFLKLIVGFLHIKKEKAMEAIEC